MWTIRHPADLPAEEVVEGVGVRRYLFPLPPFEGRALVAWPAAAWRSFSQLSRDVEQWQPDVLHVQCVSSQGIYAAALARRHRVPLVVSHQGETVMDNHDIYQRSVAMRAALRTTLAAARVVTACSAFVLADALDHFGLRPAKGRVVHNGVDLDERPPSPDERAAGLELPWERTKSPLTAGMAPLTSRVWKSDSSAGRVAATIRCLPATDWLMALKTASGEAEMLTSRDQVACAKATRKSSRVPASAKDVTPAYWE